MNLGQFILIGVLRFYQWVLSPAKAILFGPLGRCRHIPTCSSYGIEALRIHGTLRGGWLSLKRVGRCHPWGTAGYDPVPPKASPVVHRKNTNWKTRPNRSPLLALGDGVPD